MCIRDSSHAVEGFPRDFSSETYIKHLECESDIAKLVVFDTWIRNIDRHDPRSNEPQMNSDNLLYVKETDSDKYQLVPIDHSMCFFDEPFNMIEGIQEDIEDPAIYGLFPEFQGYINDSSVADAIGYLSSLSEEFVLQCVNSIPPEWHLGDSMKTKLCHLICQRAKFVVDTASVKLVDNPRLPGI